MNTAGAFRSGRAGWIVSAVLLLVAGACSPRGGGDARSRRDAASAVRHHVIVHGVRFDPESLAVAVGDTVEWDNRDLVPHTSIAPDGAWSSGNIAPDSSWSTVIARPGVTAYTCSYHPTMKGKITAR